MKFSLILLIACLPVLSRAQASQSTQQPKIELVAKYDLSSETTAHTYKLIAISSGISSEDSNGTIEPEKEIQAMIDSFKSQNGVNDCSFDHATQTLTIITDPLTDLSEVVNSINTKTH